MKQKEFNCYKCKFRGNIDYSYHSQCNHPSATEKDSIDLNIIGDPQGIKGGWFNFPYNFDPVWVKNCDGFQQKGD